MKRILAICLLLTNCISNAGAQGIITMAGVGTSSFSGDGGAATAARLASPVAIVRDASGNFYIVDQGNHRIRKVTASTAYISTIAGSSTPGYSGDGGAATSAQLYNPAAIALDASGNIYIADKGNHVIRKISAATGVISTIAGTGTSGFGGDGSAATAARLNSPAGLALDAAGNIYISDQYNQRIRKVTVATGIISTVAGDGTYGYSGDAAAATSAWLANPAGIRVDASGNIFFADLFNHVVRKITAATGVISTVAGTGIAGFSGDGGAATSAKLNYPADIALDASGNLYIAVQYSHRIRKVSATGTISTIAGKGTAAFSGDGGLATDAELNYPTGIFMDGSGNLYIADRENNRVRIVCNWSTLPLVSSPVNYCAGATAVALSATGSSLKWWNSRSGGTGSTTAPVPGTATAGSTVYYVSSTSPAGCDGPRDSITVIVNPVPAAPSVVTPVTYCRGSSSTSLTATGSTLKWYTAASGGSGSSTAPVPATTAAGSTTYYVSQTSVSGCESVRSALTVNVITAPSAPAVTSPVDYCMGSAATALSATGDSLKWYTTASGGTGSASAPVPATTTTGSTNWYVSQVSPFGCGESPRAAITVQVHALPAKPVPVTDTFTYCTYGSRPIALTAYGGPLNWYSTATGDTGSSTAPIPVVTSAGTFKYYVSKTDGYGCESKRDSIIVFVNSSPAAPTVVTPLTLCLGTTPAALTATGTSLKWYEVMADGTPYTSIVPSTAALGTRYYFVSSTAANGCEGPRERITVNVTESAAPRVTDLLFCQGFSYGALTATGTGLKWYTDASGGIGTGTAPRPSTATADTTVYYVSQTTVCGESPRSALTVRIKPTPLSPVVITPVTYCTGGIASVLSATGTNIKWYTPASGSIPVTIPPTPAVGTAGAFTYYATQTNTYGCESPKAAITVTIRALPAAPSVTSPVSYCKDATAAALAAGGAGLQWYTASSGGAGSSTAPVPSTATTGRKTWYVSQTSVISGCEGPRAVISVDVYNTPSAPAAPASLSYCTGTEIPVLHAAGTNLLWYSAASGGLGDTATPAPSSAVAGTTYYYVSQTSPYGCGESPRSRVAVTVKPLPVVPSVSGLVSYCMLDTAMPLSATGSDLKWYLSADDTGTTVAPVPSTDAADTFRYYVSQTSSGCEGPRDSVTVEVHTLPDAPVVLHTIVNYCKGDAAAALSATGTSLKWYGSDGTALSAAPTPSTADTGATTYYVSQSNGCEGPRAAITVNVFSALAAPVVSSPLHYCKGSTASALTASGSLLKWYSTATGGTGTAAAPVPATGTAATLTYYVSQTALEGCSESPRTALTVKITDPPARPVLSAAAYSYCIGDVPALLSATGTLLKWYSAADTSNTAPVLSTDTAGIFNYAVTQTDTLGCESAAATLTATVYAIPAAPAVSSPVGYCADAVSVPLSATGSSLKWYSLPSGGSGLGIAPTPPTSGTGATTYYVSQTGAGGCESARSAIDVVIYAKPPAPVVGFMVTLCMGSAPVPLTAIGSGLRWYTAASGDTGTTVAPSPATDIAGTTTWYVSQTSSSGCVSPKATMLVNIDTVFPAPAVITPLALCKGATTTALTATGINLQWYDKATDTSGTDRAPVPSTAVADTVTWYVSQTSAAGCESPKTPLTVRVNPLAEPPLVTDWVGYCVAAAALPLEATGMNLKWYTTARGGTAVTTAPVPATAIADTVMYYVSSTTPEGCEGPRDSIAVMVTNKPVITLSPDGSPAFVYCPDDTVVIKAAVSVLVTYQWYEGSTLKPGATGDRYKAYTDGDYRLEVINSVGCGSSASVHVSADTLPPQTLSPTDLTFCANVSIVLYCKPGGSSSSYEWIKDGLPLSTGPGSSLAITESGSYKVRVTDMYGCQSLTNTALTATYPLITKPVVTATFPLLRVPAIYSAYQWYRNDKKIPGAIASSYTVSFDGKYFVAVEDVNGCSAFSDTVSSALQVPGFIADDGIKVYPNPSTGKVRINAPVPVQVDITDISGKTVEATVQGTELDISTVADGLYIFYIRDNNGLLLRVEKINKVSNM